MGAHGTAWHHLIQGALVWSWCHWPQLIGCDKGLKRWLLWHLAFWQAEVPEWMIHQLLHDMVGQPISMAGNCWAWEDLNHQPLLSPVEQRTATTADLEVVVNRMAPKPWGWHPGRASEMKKAAAAQGQSAAVTEACPLPGGVGGSCRTVLESAWQIRPPDLLPNPGLMPCPSYFIILPFQVGENVQMSPGVWEQQM